MSLLIFRDSGRDDIQHPEFPRVIRDIPSGTWCCNCYQPKWSCNSFQPKWCRNIYQNEAATVTNLNDAVTVTNPNIAATVTNPNDATTVTNKKDAATVTNAHQMFETNPYLDASHVVSFNSITQFVIWFHFLLYARICCMLT